MIQKVLSKAISHKGYKEGANNDNIFAGIAGHDNHQPYCVTGIKAVQIEGGEKNAMKNTASCIDLLKWAQANNKLVTIETGKRGDVALLNFDNGKIPQHAALLVHDYDLTKKEIQTIEFNTGAPGESQDNGGGVYAKRRPRAFIVAMIRPDYSDYKTPIGKP